MSQLLADFLLTESLKVPHIIGRGILPVGGKCILGGPPKSNKSFVLINLILDLCAGRNCFDGKYPDGSPVFPVTKPYRILYFENEIGHEGLKERILGITNGEIPYGLELYVQSKDLSLRLDTDEGRAAISEQVDSVRPDVVVFDPLAKFHLTDENSAQGMGAVMRAGDRITEKYGCALIYIHHTGKENMDNPRSGGNKLRGSSAIFADVDTYIDLRPKSLASELEPLLELDFTIRQGKPINPVFLKRLESGRIKFLQDNYGGNMIMPRLAAPIEEKKAEKKAKSEGIKSFKPEL
jgi:AAA domain